MKTLSRSLLLAVLLGMPSANAAIVDSPDGSFFTDSDSGLDWLDLTATQGLSFQEVRELTQPGGSLHGWYFATSQQFNQLIATATGTEFNQAIVGATFHNDTSLLVSLLGATSASSQGRLSAGILSDGFGETLRYAGLILDGENNDYTSPLYKSVEINTPSADLGSFLIRPSSSAVRRERPEELTGFVVDLAARGASLDNAVSLYLPAGQYTIRPINVDSGGAYTALATLSFMGLTEWSCDAITATCVNGWIHTYALNSSDAALATSESEGTDTVFSNELAYGSNIRGYQSPSLAFDNFASDVSFVLNTAGFVNFFIPYCSSCPTAGGVSLEIAGESLASGVSQIEIDIKPGSERNTLNLRSRGKLPVAIMGSPSFAVSEIDQSSLMLSGLAVSLRANRDPQCSIEDVNNDVYLDLVCHFSTDWSGFDPIDDSARLTGLMLDGSGFEGLDSYTLVGSALPTQAEAKANSKHKSR